MHLLSIRTFEKEYRSLLTVLFRHGHVSLSLPTAMVIFFTYFLLVYSCFCSISFAFRHSLKTVFPYIPRLSVADYVVKKIVTPKGFLHKHNEAVCNSLAFHLCISPFIPIDFRPLFQYCASCEDPTKYSKQEEKQMTSTKKRFAATLTVAILTTVLTVPATAVETSAIRVGSYKGSTLEVGERSGIIIGPSGTDYTVTSSDPDTVAVEQVLTFWVAVAKGSGTAVITASNSAGECGSVALTVGPAAPTSPEAPVSGDSVGLMDNMEIRQEMIWLINQTRKDNGVSELPVSEALMNAAQACSDRRYTWHHALEESQAAVDAGYPYGFGDNLTVFTGTADAAQRAVNNWINSPGHFETMIDPRCDCIGVGVTQYDGITYCYMFVGIPNSVNFYA